MVPQYYVDIIDAEKAHRRMLESPQSILEFIDSNPEQGRIFVYLLQEPSINFDGQDISPHYVLDYNKHTGELNLLDPKEPGGITNYYTLEPITQPVQEIITLLARAEFLIRLHAMKDEKISNAIQQKYLEREEKNKSINYHISLVSDALKEVHAITKKHKPKAVPKPLLKFFKQKEPNLLYNSIHAAIDEIYRAERLSFNQVHELIKKIQLSIESKNKVLAKEIKSTSSPRTP